MNVKLKTVFSYSFQLLKHDLLPVILITKFEEGRPMLQTMKPLYTPEKEAAEFGLSTTSTAEAREIKGNGQTTTSILNY